MSNTSFCKMIDIKVLINIGIVVTSAFVVYSLISLVVLVVKQQLPHEESRKSIATINGDTFYEVKMIDPRPFPDPLEQVEIRVNRSSTGIILYPYQEEPPCDLEPEVSSIFRNGELRCYAMNHPYFIWKQGSNPFEYRKDGDLRNLDPANYAYLLPVAKQQLLTGEWRWFHAFAEFLLKSNDLIVGKYVHRYAEGRFTSHELAVNPKDADERTNLIKYARELEKKCLQK